MDKTKLETKRLDMDRSKLNDTYTYRTRKELVDLLELSSIPNDIEEAASFLEQARSFYVDRIGRQPRYYFCDHATAQRMSELLEKERELNKESETRMLEFAFRGMDVILLPYKKFTR